jgi:hypothetical protein
MAEEPGGPLYSEKQAGAILRRAVERSAAAGAEGSSGISLAEMERIAAEIGIDPQHVRAAAADVSGGSTTGTPGVIDLEQIVPAELEGVIGLIRQHKPAAADLVPEVEAQELPEATPVAAEAAQQVVIRSS